MMPCANQGLKGDIYFLQEQNTHIDRETNALAIGLCLLIQVGYMHTST